MKPPATAEARRRVEAPVAPAPGGRCAGTCGDLRCGCGSLLARRVETGVELKCRRCKRTIVLPVNS